MEREKRPSAPASLLRKALVCATAAARAAAAVFAVAAAPGLE